MNLFQFLETYFFVHFFDMEKLSTINVQIGEFSMKADEILYFTFSVFAFLVGAWLVIWLPVRGIRWLARGGRR